MVPRPALTLLPVVVAAALAGCGNGGGSGPGTGSPSASSGGAGHAAAHLNGVPAVSVHETDNLTFQPNSATVHVGQLVQWVNSSSVAHNVTFDGQPSITSPTMSSQDTWDVVFTTPGTYQYHCTFHPGMTGTVTVTP